MAQHNSPKIILASGSAARKDMLQKLALEFTAIPADIDEQGLIKKMRRPGSTISDITGQLAIAKAQHIAARNTKALVIGSDQTLEFEGQILSKSKSPEESIDVLRKLSGKTHRLYSSVCVVKDADVLFSCTDFADLTMHDFNEEFLDAYAKKDQNALVSCVGGYKIEGAGAWLFSDIKGDFFTIMGMPLLPLLTFLRTKCEVLL